MTRCRLQDERICLLGMGTLYVRAIGLMCLLQEGSSYYKPWPVYSKYAEPCSFREPLTMVLDLRRSPEVRGLRGSTIYWVAVKELNLSYYIGEYIYIYIHIHTHYGNLSLSSLAATQFSFE